MAVHIEGVPRSLLGIATWFYLDRSAGGGRGLTDDQKARMRSLEREDAAKQARPH